MSKGAYVGVDGVARKVGKLYVGVDGVARKVKKGYVGVNGVARLFYESSMFAYTGAYTQAEVSVNGQARMLYTLTTSGVLTCGDCEYWMCGGGAGGESGFNSGEVDGANSTSGNGGGGGYISTGSLQSGVWAVSIGAGGAADTDGGANTLTSGDVILTAAGGHPTGDGGSGGGSGGTVGGTTLRPTVTARTPGSGQGVSTYPFGMVDLYAHCAGGGGGAAWTFAMAYISYKYRGGDGGSDGANGMQGGEETVNEYVYGGQGGSKGGGNGDMGRQSTSGLPEPSWKTSDGSFYGAGGGVGGNNYNASDVFSAGTIGYQGVVYILV